MFMFANWLFISMKDYAAAQVSDDTFAKRAQRWPEDTPDTKEAYLIRDIFDSQSSLIPFYLHSSSQFSSL